MRLARWARLENFGMRAVQVAVGGAVALFLWFVVPMILCGVWEAYYWALGAGNPQTWDDHFNIGPAYGFPHWAQVVPPRVYIAIAPTWIMLDGLFCASVHAAQKYLGS